MCQMSVVTTPKKVSEACKTPEEWEPMKTRHVNVQMLLAFGR